MVVLDSGALTKLATPSPDLVGTLEPLRRQGDWPPVVPSAVLVESLTGDPGRDAAANRLLKTCELMTHLTERLARRAAQLRHRAGRGSAVDAVVVALAEPGGVVLTGDAADIAALASHADDVAVVTI